MTNEEAIKKLEWALNNNTIYDENEALEYILAVKKGIEALEQEPCEDCISRSEALEALNSINGTSELDKAFELIEELPPVTPKSKTDVLDKIRAEIEQEYLAEGHLSDYWDAIDKCLQIVDKYKAESENKE